MSLASEWFLAVHRATWFPVLCATGLEREPIEVYPIDRGVRDQPAQHRGAPRKKAA